MVNKNKHNNNNSSNSLVFVRWPQTKTVQRKIYPRVAVTFMAAIDQDFVDRIFNIGSNSRGSGRGGREGRQVAFLSII